MNFDTLPQKGLSTEEILKILKKNKNLDVQWQKGKSFSLVYHKNNSHTEFLKQVYEMYFHENALNPIVFQSLRKLELEVIRIVANILNGDSNTVGTITSGGTESCLLAVKTYRDYAKNTKPWIQHPEMILPESAHVAFEKASEYFNVKIRKAPVDKNYQADTLELKKLISKNTILIVASAPNYPYGITDPIEELSEIAYEHKIPLHIDACLGGFLLPFLKKLNYSIPKFDFRLRGVTSISADIHKYGFGAKGASTIIYRSMNYLKYQFFISENWCGGIYASPTILGTKSGGSIAAAWATLMSHGWEGYLKNVEKIMKITEKIQKEILSIDDFILVGKPQTSIFAFTSRNKKINIYAIGDILQKKGWNVDRIQKPEALHLMITPIHEKIYKYFIKDLQYAYNEVKNNPHLAYEGNAAVYGFASSFPVKKIIRKTLINYLSEMYGKKENNTISIDNKKDLKNNMLKLILKLLKKIN